MPETIMQKRLRRWFKARFAVLYPLGFWVLLTGYSTDDSMMYSLGFIFAGIGLRAWANGYAIKMDRLTTCGPYAYLRHPLYAGSFCILTGFMLLLKIHWLFLFLVLTVIAGGIYRSTIRQEELMLAEKFGVPYSVYRRHVPAFWPRLTAFQGAERWPWSFTRYLKSQEYKILIWMVVLIIVFYLKEEFLIEHESVEVKHTLMAVTAVMLGLLDLSAEYYRKRISRLPVSFNPNI